MRDAPPATAFTTATDADRAFALGLLDGSAPPPVVKALTPRVAAALAEARAAGYAAGHETNHDDAHTAGYREGIAAVFAALPPEQTRLIPAARLDQLEREAGIR